MTEDPLIKLFSNVLGVPQIELNEATSPDNTSRWDSMRAMELVAEIEDTFGVRLSTTEIMKMRSIGIVREVLLSKNVTLPDPPPAN
jgi:acyl carrier protein